MQAENPTDVANLCWEELSELLRSNGVREEEIFKSGKAFKAGFLKGFQCGLEHREDEKEPQIGFETEEETEDDRFSKMVPR